MALGRWPGPPAASAHEGVCPGLRPCSEARNRSLAHSSRSLLVGRIDKPALGSLACHEFPGNNGLRDEGQLSFGMDVAIAKANIEHFKKLLETETDEKKRAVLQDLLAEEELKLAAALKARSDRKKH